MKKAIETYAEKLKAVGLEAVAFNGTVCISSGVEVSDYCFAGGTIPDVVRELGDFEDEYIKLIRIRGGFVIVDIDKSERDYFNNGFESVWQYGEDAKSLPVQVEKAIKSRKSYYKSYGIEAPGI